ncbi:MAG: type II toxin-antitoxin system VapC family toxin [Actinomycetota bacterium]|nr:type II toxin-antitoxin system VapC family toxin [Actinomycetota bacterium]
MLVLDANVVIPACTRDRGFRRFGRQALVAPPLMWSEARSSLHEAVWRGELREDAGVRALGRLESSPVEARTHPGVGFEAWRIADELGFAKTYDAEYLALASLLGCRLVTLDGRLRRGADRLGLVIGPGELER